MSNNNNNNSPKYNLRKRKKKNIPEIISDDDSSSDFNPNDEKNYNDICDYISEIFPNKYGKNNIKYVKQEENKKPILKTKKNKPKKNKLKKKNNKIKYKKNNENNELKSFIKKKKQNYNIILAFDDDDDNDNKNMSNYISYFDYYKIDDDEDYEYDENDENNITDSSDDDEKINKSLEINEKVKIKLKNWDGYYPGTIKKIRKNGHYDIKLNDELYDIIKDVPIKYIISIEKEKNHSKLLNELEQLSIAEKDNNLLEKFKKLSNAYKIKKEEDEKKKNDVKKSKNCKKFTLLLREKNKFNDIKYFKSLNIENQEKIISNLKEINKFNQIKKPYRILLIEKDIPICFKAIAIKKINSFNNMDTCNSEYYKLKNWIDGFMQIPFGNFCKLPLQISDGLDKCSEFLDKSKKILDDCVFGLETAKMQLLQYIGQWIVNPNTIGTAIAIKGPPGTGKTTLIKEGVSKILNRPFGFITLGGATDSSYLEGHSYTYEGSIWGKIIDIVIQSKCMNPIIFMDELDKISESPKGEEITGILTHLTDTTQNDKFHDKYFSSLDFNLSKTLFIFSYNDESKINKVLKDRLYRIQTDGFTSKDKLTICKNYIIPKIEKNLNFDKNNIIFTNDVLEYIIKNYTEDEKGVRNLKRCIEIIFTKINLFRLSKKNNYLFKNMDYFEIKFPFKLTIDIVNKIINKNKISENYINMYT